MFKAEKDIQSCSELGLLTDPKSLIGNWYLSTCEGGSEIGIDQAGIIWHNRVAFKWELEKWYKLKIMVSAKNKTIYGKMWTVGDKEPDKWLTESVITTHLDQDGVGLVSYHCITYFDDVIVATSEDSLMSVDHKGKLAITWGEAKR